VRRDADLSTVCIALGPREAEAVAEMQRVTGLTSAADLMRVALYRFGCHLDMNFDTSLFRPRRSKTREPKTHTA